MEKDVEVFPGRLPVVKSPVFTNITDIPRRFMVPRLVSRTTRFSGALGTIFVSETTRFVNSPAPPSYPEPRDATLSLFDYHRRSSISRIRQEGSRGLYRPRHRVARRGSVSSWAVQARLVTSFGNSYHGFSGIRCLFTPQFRNPGARLGNKAMRRIQIHNVFETSLPSAASRQGGSNVLFGERYIGDETSARINRTRSSSGPAATNALTLRIGHVILDLLSMTFAEHERQGRDIKKPPAAVLAFFSTHQIGNQRNDNLHVSSI